MCNSEILPYSLFQKVRRYELELSQALDLAAGYKLKADVAEKERASVMAVADKKNFELSAKLKDIEESNRNTQSKLLESEDKIQLLQDKLSWMEQNFSEVIIQNPFSPEHCTLFL